MTEKQYLELLNLRKRIVAQRDEIKRLQAEVEKMSAERETQRHLESVLRGEIARLKRAREGIYAGH